MKKQLLIVSTLVLALLSYKSYSSSEIIELPIKFVNGYGGLSYSYKGFSGNIPEESPWYKTKEKVTGIPEDWTDVQTEFVWLDPHQFVFQNEKKGNFPDGFFDAIKSAWNINSNKAFSEEPIKCYVYVIYHKDENGNIRYKVDTNNNLDFSDEIEHSAYQTENLVGKSNQQVDSIMTNLAHPIKYEALIKGIVVELEVPLLIIRLGNYLGSNIVQHAEAEFENTKILITSQNFGSTHYDPASIYLESNKNHEVKQNEYITLNGENYQNLGVDINRQVLKLKKIGNGEGTYSSQVGFAAIPFSGNDFITQEKISLESYKGKFLFIDFWGSWCGPCIEELPSMKNAYQNLDKSKIEFLGIAKDNAVSLRNMLEKQNIEWKQILCDDNDKIIKDYNVTGYPTTLLIDPNGKIIAKNLRGENLLDILNSYIEKY